MQGQRHLADVQAEINYRQEYLHGKADALQHREAVLTTREDTLLRTAAQRPLYAGETVVLVRDLFFEDTGAEPVPAGTHAVVTKIPGDRPGSHCEVRTVTTQRIFDVGARDIERLRAPLPGPPGQAAAHDAVSTAPLGSKHLPSPLPHTPLQQPPPPQQHAQQQQQPAPPLQARSVSGISARHSAEGSSVARADNQIDRFWMGQKGGGGGQDVYVPKQRGGAAAAAQLPACGTAAVPGARRALVIGVDYSGTAHAVPQHLGTEAAKQAAAMLASKRFEGETRVLAERQAAPHLRPTKRNILASVAWLVEGAQHGDVLFFSFCGHSLMEEDLPTSPSERFHQCVAPSDYLQSGYLYVTELFEHFVRLPHGVKLTCLFDTDPGILLPAKYRIASSGETGVNTDAAAGTPQATIYAISSCPIQKIQSRLSGQRRAASAPQTTGVLTPAFCTAMQWRGAATTVKQLLEDVRHMVQGRVSGGGAAAEIVVTSTNACSMPDVFTLAHLTPVEDERRIRAWSARLAEERGRLEAVESKVSGKRAAARDRDSLSSAAAAAAAAAGASSYAPFAAPHVQQQQRYRPSKQQQELQPEQQLSRQQRDVAASNRIVMDLYDVI